MYLRVFLVLSFGNVKLDVWFLVGLSFKWFLGIELKLKEENCFIILKGFFWRKSRIIIIFIV